ncbi:MAG: FlgD immunoglobulin-like domain containing protein [Armatimonadota bacterium]
MTSTPCITLQAEGSIQIGTTGGTSLLRDANIAMTSGYPWGVYPGGIYISMRETRNNQTRTYVWGRSAGAPNVVFDRSWPGASGVYIRRQWYVEGWQTDMRIELIQTVVRIELRVRNSGTEPASLTLRLASDVEVGVEEGVDTNGASLPPYVYVYGQRPIRVDTDLRGVQVPPAVEFYLARGDLNGASRYILRPTTGFEDATPIERLVFGEWFFIQATTNWDPLLFPDSFIGDVAINLFTSPRSFAPGQERIFVFYVTMTPVNIDVQPPIALGVETLPVIEPNQRDLSQLANGGVFEVIAAVTNMFHVVGKEVDLRNVTVDLSLPAGITLAAGESRTKPIASIPPESTSYVRWRVVADPRAVGFATLRVSVSAPPAPPKTVSRTILISATASRELRKGFQIISIPFDTAAPLVDVLGLPEGTYLAKRWNPDREVYETIDTLQPGMGFWLYLPNEGTNITLSRVRFPQAVFTASVPIRLNRGWNQIGNPYPYPLVLGQIVVVSASDPRTSLSFFEASQRGVIRSVIYYWDEFSGEYKFTSDPNTPLIPHRGYWIKCNDDIELVFPPVFLPGTGFGGAPRSQNETTNHPNEWRLQLIARTARGEDSQNYIGITSGRSAGEVEEPPAPLAEVPVRLTLLKAGVPLMQDVRPASVGRHTFELLVEAPVGEEVRLRAPNVRTVPAGYRLRLTDQSTGRTVDLRHTPEYRFISSGRNRFTLTVERGARGGALITSINVGAVGRDVRSVSISYVLAQDAQTDVTILGADGRVIASLQRGRAATRGVNMVVWNLRDNEGRAVPPGTYRVQVEARDSEGQVARAVRPLIVTR